LQGNGTEVKETDLMEKGLMEAEIRIKVKKPENFRDAFSPEKGTERVKEDVKIEDGNVLVTLKAKDLSALKAVLNSYLSWLDMGEKFGGEK